MEKLESQFKNSIPSKGKKSVNKCKDNFSNACKVQEENFTGGKIQCRNCLVKTFTCIVKEFSSWKGSDDKLQCPFCMSLELEEVSH